MSWSVPRSQEEAKRVGLAIYFPEQPCKHGHVPQRFASDRKCVECRRLATRKAGRKFHTTHLQKSRAAHRVYARQYRARHYDKVLASNRDYYRRKHPKSPP